MATEVRLVSAWREGLNQLSLLEARHRDAFDAKREELLTMVLGNVPKKTEDSRSLNRTNSTSRTTDTRKCLNGHSDIFGGAAPAPADPKGRISLRIFCRNFSRSPTVIVFMGRDGRFGLGRAVGVFLPSRGREALGFILRLGGGRRISSPQRLDKTVSIMGSGLGTV